MSRTISDDDVEAVIVRTLQEKPTGATHWSTRDLAAKAGISPSSVGRIWRAFGLKPWLTDTFTLSEDPQFVDKVRDVVGLYMNPPEHAVVMCVDDKTSIQALDRTQPSLPMRPGQIERRTHGYKRHGVTDLFAALNLATGQVVHQTRQQHRAVEFGKFLDLIDETVPADLTQTSSSWMNLVERWFAELTNKMLKRSARTSIAALTNDLNAWIAAWNTNPKPFVWHKTTDQILDSLKKHLTNL